MLVPYTAGLEWDYFQFHQHKKLIYFETVSPVSSCLRELEENFTLPAFNASLPRFNIEHDNLILWRTSCKSRRHAMAFTPAQLVMRRMIVLHTPCISVLAYKPAAVLIDGSHRVNYIPFFLSFSLSTEKPKLVQRKSHLVLIYKSVCVVVNVWERPVCGHHVMCVTSGSSLDSFWRQM